jgi:SLT domain-containing protein
MIDRTKELVDTVNELHAAIDTLPDVKNIEITVTGTALDDINAIHAAVDLIPDSKTVEINVVYKNIGGPEAIAEQTEIVKQVIVPASDQIKDATQVVQQVTESAGGGAGDENIGDLDAAKEAAAALAAENEDLGTSFDEARAKMDDFSAGADLAKEQADALAAAIQDAADHTHDAGEEFKDSGSWLDDMISEFGPVAEAAKVYSEAADDGESATRGLSAAVADSLPLWEQGSGIFGAWNSHIQLFGGALTSVGLPAIIATAGGIHILLDAIVEIGSTLIPAGIAFGAFAIGAAGIVTDLYQHMVDLFTVTQALQQNMYPFTGALTALQNAVKPEVYVLFGEALNTMNTNTGVFTTLATAAGGVLDQLGARIEAAVSNGNGFSTFIKNAASDLAGWGDLIGNVFGILGNILKTLPGYGRFFLELADDFTAFVESVTSSGIVQDLIGVGLAAHGFILWAGLGVTAAVALADAFVGLGIKLGLVSDELVIFDAASFGTGIKLMGSYIAETAVALFTMAGAEDTAAAASGILEGALIALDAVNPVVWVGLAVGALVGLIAILGRSTTASDQFTQSISAAIQNAPNLGTAFQVATTGLGELKINLAETDTQIDAVSKQISAIPDGSQLSDASDKVYQYNASWTELNRTLSGLQNTQAADKAEIQDVNTYLGNYSDLVHAAGGNTSILSALNITVADTWNASKSQLATYNMEIAAYQSAVKAASDGTGRFAAAENALSFTSEDANNKLGQIYGSMQQVTQAQTSLIGVLVAGESSFVTFAQGLQTLATDGKAAGATMTGLTANSLSLQQQFYQQVNSMQSVIEAEENQGVSTKTLQTEVATMAGEMLAYSGNNEAAKGIIVDLINDALGPQTASLKTVNSWVKQNSTSQQGLASDIEQTTLKASVLAQTLTGDVNQAMAQSIVAAHGGQGAFNAFAEGVLSGNTQSQAFYSAGQNVIAVLKAQTGNVPAAENAFIQYAMNGLGETKSQAVNLYDELTGQLPAGIQTAQGAIDTIKDHTDKFGQALDPGLTGSINQAGSTSDEWKNSKLGPAQTAIDVIKSHTDIFGQSLDPGLTGNLDSAGSHSDTLKNSHLSPLQQIVQDLNTFVGNFEKAMGNWPSSESTNVKVTGTGGANIKSTVPGVSGGVISVIAGAGLGLAGGGVIPGYNPGFDSVPALLSPGEGVLIPQVVKAMGGASAINRLNEHYKQNEQHFASGGIVLPNVTGTAAKIGGTAITDITDAFQQTMIAAFAHMQSEASAYQAAQKAAEGSGKLLAGSTSGSVASWLTQALKADGKPQSWLGDLEWLVNAESSGNPDAVDPIVVDGQNATGLLQTLPSTFSEYANPSVGGGILNPVANAAAAINYIASRYGSPGNIPGIGVHDSGYDSGGWLMPGLTLAHNNTGQPERVVGPQENNNQTLHATFMIDGKQVFEAMAPIAYQKAARNNGNGNASAYWTPGNKR